MSTFLWSLPEISEGDLLKIIKKRQTWDRVIKKLLNLVIANVAIGVCLAINFVILRFGEIFVCSLLTYPTSQRHRRIFHCLGIHPKFESASWYLEIQEHWP